MKRNLPAILLLLATASPCFSDQDLYGMELLEFLSTRAGLSFMSTDSYGGEEWLTMRGLPGHDSKNVLVLLDGAPLNNAWDDGVEWDDVPVQLIERIEIYREPAVPVEYGGYTSGVINIITGEEVRGHAGEISIGMGSRSTFEYEQLSQGKVGSISYLRGEHNSVR